jgi:hypothetical protein
MRHAKRTCILKEIKIRIKLMENDLQEHEGMDTCEEKGKKKGENKFCIST